MGWERPFRLAFLFPIPLGVFLIPLDFDRLCRRTPTDLCPLLALGVRKSSWKGRSLAGHETISPPPLVGPKGICLRILMVSSGAFLLPNRAPEQGRRTCYYCQLSPPAAHLQRKFASQAAALGFPILGRLMPLQPLHSHPPQQEQCFLLADFVLYEGAASTTSTLMLIKGAPSVKRLSHDAYSLSPYGSCRESRFPVRQ